ncbi:MAG: GDSL-type esterase/lipase family protein [Gemmatales bacterium]|nr:GDSL-type esterase/lipase family protein [Gemmatales bacterium]MDW7994082.1 GDSL-type esterase/lipase family protein [Gemmatales bacterium]
MQSFRLTAVVTLLVNVLIGAAAQEQLHSAIKPVPRDAKWLKRHETFVALAKRGGIDVLFLGDSITDSWGGEGHSPQAPGAKIFAREFVPLQAANFGIGGDRTQHVLWRIQNGALDGIQPKVVMLLIGTNNTNGNDNTAEEIAEGITAIVREIHKRSPKTKILLLGIFPRGKDPNDPATKTQREKIARVNQIIAKLDDGGKTVKYLDIGHLFIRPDGHISPDLMPDYLHLSEKGYELWAQAVKPIILELLKQ